MKKVLITGGSGTVGYGFIKKYYNKYIICTTSRNQEKINRLQCDFPKITCYNYGIEQKEQLENIFKTFQPDIVIHAAALKHVDIAELSPTQCITTNIIGSINVLNACINNNIKKCIAISTDKASCQANVYGTTKYLMEKIFIEHKKSLNIGICRFGNIANSTGSVLPYWKKLSTNQLPIRITNPEMNRFLFTITDALDIIDECIKRTDNDSGFILTKKMKCVNLKVLADLISTNQEIIGQRPGEKIDEELVSEQELEYTEVDNDWILLRNYKTEPSKRLTQSINTITSNKLSKQEIINIIHELE
jgi:UDP-glucose 4-epimerase